MSKIGLAITTFNSESYFKELYESIPMHKINELVIINGGDPYEKEYLCNKWIQHPCVKFASVARNDGLKYLQETDCEYLFMLEDDMIIKNENIFDKYIEASNISGMEYMCFASNAWQSGHAHHRTPRLQIQYSDDIIINLFRHTCNELTFRTKNSLNTSGLYDERFKYLFDIEALANMHYKNIIRFWNFPDISDSDDYIMNNPNAISRMNADGERDGKSMEYMTMFIQKYGHHVVQMPDTNKEDMISFAKNKKINRRLYE